MMSGASRGGLVETVDTLPERPYALIEARLADARLRDPVKGAVQAVEDLFSRLLASYLASLEPELEAYRAVLEPDLSTLERERALRILLGRPRDDDSTGQRARQSELVRLAESVLTSAPGLVTTPLEPHWLEPFPGETRTQRLRRWARRAALRLRPGGRASARHVPIRTILRIALMPRIVRALHNITDTRYRIRACILEDLRLFLRGALNVSQTLEAIEERLSYGAFAVQRESLHHLRAGAKEAVEMVERVDSPALPLSRLRYGDVEPDVRASTIELEEGPARWCALLEAQRQTVYMKLALNRFERHAEQVLEDQVVTLLARSGEALAEEASHVSEQLARLLDTLQQAETFTPDVLRQAQEMARHAFSRRTRGRVNQRTARFRHQFVAHQLSGALELLIEALPDALTVISPATPLHKALDPDEVVVTEARLFDIAERHITRGYVPVLLKHHAAALEMVGSVPGRLFESVHGVSFVFEVGLRGQIEDASDLKSFVLAAVERAQERVVELQTELEKQTGFLIHEVKARLEEALREVEEEISKGAVHAVHRLGSGSLVATVQAGAERVWAGVREGSSRGARWVRTSWVALREGRNVWQLRVRSGLEVLDPGRMRRYVQAQLAPPPLPSIYERLFSLQPLDDQRFFVARRAQLRTLSEIERSWREGSRAAVLVTGPGGSGKTSLLNMFQLQVKVERMIRINNRFNARADGLVQALASELECAPVVELVLSALERKPTAVLIDSLETWFQPTLAGVERLNRFQRLVVQSDCRVFWVVGVQWNALLQLERLGSWRSAFSHHLELPPLAWQEARNIIRARHRFSGLELRYGTQSRRLWRLLWRRRTEEEHYFRNLTRAASGNARSILYLHLRAAVIKDGVVVTGAPQPAEIPFLLQLPDDALVILSEILRLGPLSIEELAELLRIELDRVALQVAQLKFIGFLGHARSEHTVQVPKHVYEPLTQELHELHRLPRGVS